MITQFRVKNYLSLREVDLELRPRKNIIVGPNMSGKSNLIDCFKFLTHMVTTGLNKAFLDRGGFSEVVWKGSDESRISFQVVAEFAAESAKSYTYDLAIIGSPTGLISVEKEHLIVQSKDTAYTLIDLENGHGRISHADGTEAFAPPGPGRSALEFAVPGWEGTQVNNFIASWHFYRLIPAVMKQVNGAVGQGFLNENGDNFSSWFMTLQSNHPEEFRLLHQAAVDAFPDLKTVFAPVTQSLTATSSHEKHLTRPITLWRMSDGELSFLALLSLIFAPEALGAPLYCIEEPENHLHPRLLETLVELLNQRQNALGSRAAQLIATTHSPYLVDQVDLDDLLVAEKHHGASQYTRPASKSHLRELLEREELGLGDLWYAGALGGVPC
jgi:predicted ATPase